MLTVQEGYYIIYHFLSIYWDKVDKFEVYEKEAFILVDIISTMDPGSVNNPMPIDPAKYQDWINIMSNLYGNKNSFTEKDIFNGMINFLKFYVDHFHFQVQNVIDDILLNFDKKYYLSWDKIIRKQKFESN